MILDSRQRVKAHGCSCCKNALDVLVEEGVA